MASKQKDQVVTARIEHAKALRDYLEVWESSSKGKTKAILNAWERVKATRRKAVKP